MRRKALSPVVTETPIIRKLTQHGTSRAVNLPSGWIDHIERVSGKRLNEVLLEVNGSIEITPYMGADSDNQKLRKAD
ncbi:hypothetical protein MUP59_06635 [Candidatus Bathyarchaeota archaeon]|nr:hypothetical protein [Candidatus Bathyarchaeota archaeon]